MLSVAVMSHSGCWLVGWLCRRHGNKRELGNTPPSLFFLNEYDDTTDHG